MHSADKAPQLRRMAQHLAQSPSTTVYFSCESSGQVAATVNVGKPAEDPASIAKVNGIVARYQAYASALVILADRVSFPTTNGQHQDWPDGYKRRPS
jgi:hypothetical protein